MVLQQAGITTDTLLADVPVLEGYKVLGGVALYQKLGQGGMGAVYRGRHIRLNVDVAVKVMAPPSGLSEEGIDAFIKRFIREAQTSASINHPNLLRVMDVNSQGNAYYIVMDYVDGESASERLHRRGSMFEREAALICLAAAEGLAEAHRQGIVHRDVKPDNIMIDKEGRVTVTDLGLAKAYSTGEEDIAVTLGISISEQAMGTPNFMSPEQTRSAKDVGPAADVWSLGVTMYHLLTGELPWHDTDLSDLIQKIRSAPPPDIDGVCSGLSEGIKGIVRKALRKEITERYADCGEMAVELQEHLDSTKGTSQTTLIDEKAGSTRHTLIIDPPPDRQTLTLISDSVATPMPTPSTPQHALETIVDTPAPVPGTAGQPLPTPGSGAVPQPKSGLRIQLLLGTLLLALVGTAAVFFLLGRSGDPRSGADEAARTARGTSEEALALRAKRESEERARREAEAKREADAKIATFLAAAVTFREAGLPERARDALVKVLEIRPDHAEAKRLLSEIQTQLVGAKTETERAAGYKRWMEEGLSLKLKGKVEGAGHAYAKAAEYAPPGSKEAENAAAACFHDHYRSEADKAGAEGDLVRAANLYRKALAMRDDVDTRRLAAAVKKKLDAGKAEEARKAETRRLRVGARDAERRGDLKAALRDYRKAEKLGAGVAKKIASLEGELKYREAIARARALIGRGKWKESASLLKGVLKVRPGDEQARSLLAEARKHLAPPPALTVDLGGGVAMELVYVKAGRFVMGSNRGESDERPAHEVVLNGFYIGKHEVTQAQYERISGGKPSRFRGADRPVERVSRNDAAAFCKRLSARTGREFRLPTEAEWEYACRAGSKGKYSFSEDESLTDYAWFGKSGLTALGGRTHNVGQKRPNAWGLYDMHGNVWEWCSDFYGATYYRSSPRADPRGPDSGRYGTVRGGSWSSKFVGSCRSANRERKGPRLKSAEVGFRVVSPVEPD